MDCERCSRDKLQFPQAFHAFFIIFNNIFSAAILFLSLRKESYKIIRWKVPKVAIVMFFLAMSFGWFMHILLDCSLSGDGYLNFIPSFPLGFCPHPFPQDVLAGFDAIILVFYG